MFRKYGCHANNKNNDDTKFNKNKTQGSDKHCEAMHLKYWFEWPNDKSLYNDNRVLRQGRGNGNDDARKQWSDWLNEEK